MHNLAEGVRRFQQEVFPTRAALFEELAATHQPTALFIGCSDARVVPELITQREPGELFVIRTAGNLVPAYAPGADGVAASIEYAVGVLGVTDVIVCGHSGCGAMTSLALRHDLAGLPAVADWLRQAGAATSGAATAHAADATVAEKVSALVRANILSQLAHLTTHPSVARALAQHTVTLHGWLYDIGSGSVEELDTASGRFTPLAA